MSLKLFLARFRSIISRIVAVIIIAFIVFVRPPDYLSPFFLDILEMTGLILLAIAAFGRVWCLVYIGGKKDLNLITDGPFSIVRNPLYLFSFIGAVGLGLAVENPLIALIIAILFSVYYSFVVRNEESELFALFGNKYHDYFNCTPRWIPNFRLYKEPNKIEIYPANVRKGISDAIWFIWAFLLWELLETLRAAGFWPF